MYTTHLPKSYVHVSLTYTYPYKSVPSLLELDVNVCIYFHILYLQVQHPKRRERRKGELLATDTF